LPDQPKDAEKPDNAEFVQKRILEFTGDFEEIRSHSSIPLYHKWQCRNDHFWQRCSSEALDFLRWLLNPKPDKRPSAVEALEHPWLEMHRPQPSRITSEMAISLASYVKAPKVLQCCMVIVAASLGAPELEDVSAAFLTADSDCDGIINVKELRHALAEIVYPSEPDATIQAPVKDLLLSGDLGINDGLGFTEFLAACSFGKQASLDRLIEEAFHALDVDRDGLVLAGDTQAVFESDGDSESVLSQLPESHAFSLEEWCSHVKACMTGRPVAEVAAAAAANPQARMLPKSTPTLRIRRRGPRGCC
jgi:Ca2+-binding EF-hand superfamily protein